MGVAPGSLWVQVVCSLWQSYRYRHRFSTGAYSSHQDRRAILLNGGFWLGCTFVLV